MSTVIEWNEFFFLFQAPKVKKRQRKTVNRFGRTEKEVNKDEYFENSENDGASTGSSDDEEFVVLGNKSKMTKITDDIHKVEQLQTQIAKIEAKIDGVADTMQKMLRTVMSVTNNNNRNVGDGTTFRFLSRLPIKTEESLTDFENDLHDDDFRYAAVKFLFYFLYWVLFICYQLEILWDCQPITILPFWTNCSCSFSHATNYWTDRKYEYGYYYNNQTDEKQNFSLFFNYSHFVY